MALMDLISGLQQDKESTLYASLVLKEIESDPAKLKKLRQEVAKQISFLLGVERSLVGNLPLLDLVRRLILLGIDDCDWPPESVKGKYCFLLDAKTDGNPQVRFLARRALLKYMEHRSLDEIMDHSGFLWSSYRGQDCESDEVSKFAGKLIKRVLGEYPVALWGDKHLEFLFNLIGFDDPEYGFGHDLDIRESAKKLLREIIFNPPENLAEYFLFLVAKCQESQVEDVRQISLALAKKIDPDKIGSKEGLTTLIAGQIAHNPGARAICLHLIKGISLERKLYFLEIFLHAVDKDDNWGCRQLYAKLVLLVMLEIGWSVEELSSKSSKSLLKFFLNCLDSLDMGTLLLAKEVIANSGLAAEVDKRRPLISAMFLSEEGED